MIGNYTYTENIDELMKPEKICTRFPSVDPYQSIYSYEDIPLKMDYVEWSQRYANILDILHKKHDNVLIVAHASHLLDGVPYIAGRYLSKFSRYVCGDEKTGTLCKYEDRVVNVFQEGKLIYENYPSSDK
jgi:broad specificity phosphatase PhoE